MMRLPNMLLLGSAGRNAGKTALACAVLAGRPAAAGAVGLKVTAIRRNGGACPRGGRGCGACASLKGDYCITEEDNPRSPKDTGRLLAAGAEKVFWLRVRTGRLAEGMAALLAVAGRGPCVCESNSLRTVVEPGLFLMLRAKGARAWKATARAVREFADRTVVFDGGGFDLDPADLSFDGRGWVLREHATAIVLAGGRGTRMGRDKSMLPVGARPMIEHVCAQLRDVFDEVLVSTNTPEEHAFLGLRTVPDRAPGRGPLMGIASALEASAHELNFVVACDAPDLNIALAHRLLDRAAGRDAVVPRGPGGAVEPLFAVYRKSLAPRAHRLLGAGEGRVRALFAKGRTRYVDLPPGEAVPANLNTREEYAAHVAARADKL